MRQLRILLMAALLMACDFTVSGNQSQNLVTGANFVTCQVSPGGNISDPTFLTIPNNFSDPNGPPNGHNAILLWWIGTAFVPYYYFNSADATTYVGASSPAGWYDSAGNPVTLTWNPGVGAVIDLPGYSGTITFNGAAGSPTTFPWPSGDVYALRGSPDPNVHGGNYALPSDIVQGTPQNGDAIYVFKNGSSLALVPQNYTTYYYDINQGGWVPNVPALQLGGTGGLPTTKPYTSVFLGPLQSAVIEGNVYQGACGSTIPLANWTVQAVSGGNAYYGISGANGHYVIIVPTAGNYIVSSYNPPAGWNQACGGPYSLNNVAAGSFYPNNNFTENPPVVHADASVDLESFFPYPLRSPCCGQNMTFVVSARNDGTIAIAGVSVVLTFNGTMTTPAPPAGWTAVVGANSVTWTHGAWAAKASQEFTATVTLPASPCSGTISAVAKISYTGWLAGANKDVNPADNQSVLNQNITCSYDPNDMLVDPAGCGPEGYIPPGQPLTYTVKFQNTGNGPASLVIVSNTLDSNLDPTTVQVLGSSAPNVFQVQGNQLVWTFPNIYLPPQSEDDLGSQGYVKYQVSPLASAPAGAVITNNAQIYFDLNAPVMTVTATNTIIDAPAPVASFSVTPAVGSGGQTNSFTYTGGSSGATYLWNFGPDAIPSTSTDQNPANVVFPDQGPQMVTLQVSLGDCMSDPAVQIITVGIPLLTAELDDNGNLVLSWQGTGYHLQQRADLQPGTPWTATTATVNQMDSSFSAAIPLSANATYYRLSQVPP